MKKVVEIECCNECPKFIYTLKKCEIKDKQVNVSNTIPDWCPLEDTIQSNNDPFVVITWPDIQELMGIKGFFDNVSLIENNPFLEEYGSSAYFVRKTWLDKVDFNQK